MRRLILIPVSFVIASSAFAQSRCVTAPVNITGDRMTLTSSGVKSVTENETYVYYEQRHSRKDDEPPRDANSPRDEYSSDPLLLNSDKDVKAVPETYNVSLSTPQSNVSVCPDSTLNLNATINVEKVSSFTGNYPQNDNKMYKQVSKRSYMAAARKKRKIERKEEKIGRKTLTDVDVKSGKV